MEEVSSKFSTFLGSILRANPEGAKRIHRKRGYILSGVTKFMVIKIIYPFKKQPSIGMPVFDCFKYRDSIIKNFFLKVSRIIATWLNAAD
ncbi:hypothetical protein [Elizabethkingia argenteiflava]|uniref:hypothetical protein n=1 Tax=Elizabethkingia argenteiflava TaxID=2681556 RepID=UPI001FCE538A|nr:hypothetical protein [Elizabethkingia argenteiflava]